MSSRRRQRRSACTGKIAHPDKATAVSAAISLRRAEGVRNISAYHCRFCHAWHIGHRG